MRRTSHPRRRSGRTVGERGSATLEITILFPALLLMICAIVQAGLWFYARNVALAGAQEGVRAVAAAAGSSGQGQEAAMSFINRAGGDWLTGVTVTASRGTVATVTVAGTALSLVPGMNLDVRQSATLPVERIT